MHQLYLYQLILLQVVEKFLTKMTNEENKYQDHLAELEGAMNPDAEAVVTQVI